MMKKRENFGGRLGRTGGGGKAGHGVVLSVLLLSHGSLNGARQDVPCLALTAHLCYPMAFNGNQIRSSSPGDGKPLVTYADSLQENNDGRPPVPPGCLSASPTRLGCFIAIHLNKTPV